MRNSVAESCSAELAVGLPGSPAASIVGLTTTSPEMQREVTERTERRVRSRRVNQQASRAVYKLLLYYRATRTAKTTARFALLGLPESTIAELIVCKFDRRQRRGRSSE